MMSLAETSVLEVAKTQYRYKMKANAGLFFTLIAAQLLAFLISYGSGAATSSIGSTAMTYSIKHISGDIIIVFTLIWAFIIGISAANNGFKGDFTFVSNRLSSHLSSMGYLLSAALFAGISATLCGMLLRLIFFFSKSNAIIDAGFWIHPAALAAGTLAAVLYALLLSSLGYFSGMLVQKNRAFIVLLPGLFFGTLIVETRSIGQPQTINSIIHFFTQEVSPALLAAKAIVTAVLLLGAVILFSDRMEVRQ